MSCVSDELRNLCVNALFYQKHILTCTCYFCPSFEWIKLYSSNLILRHVTKALFVYSNTYKRQKVVLLVKTWQKEICNSTTIFVWLFNFFLSQRNNLCIPMSFHLASCILKWEAREAQFHVYLPLVCVFIRFLQILQI